MDPLTYLGPDPGPDRFDVGDARKRPGPELGFYHRTFPHWLLVPNFHLGAICLAGKLVVGANEPDGHEQETSALDKA